jgi:hypothetical protein
MGLALARRQPTDTRFLPTIPITLTAVTAIVESVCATLKFMVSAALTTPNFLPGASTL